MATIYRNVSVNLENNENKSLIGKDVACKVHLEQKDGDTFYVIVNKTPEKPDMRSLGKGVLSGIEMKFNNKNGKYCLNFSLTAEKLINVGKTRLKSEVNGLIEKVYGEV